MSRMPSAQENEPVLPEPLTLEFALSLTGNDHPDNRVAQSRMQGAQASRDNIEGNDGLQTRLEGRLRWFESPGRSLSSDRDDHRIALSASKRLYDFGRSSADSAAAEALINTRKWLLTDQYAQHHINIMDAFFNVILADLAYARDNELMAIAYVRFDQDQDRNKLGQIPDVDLLETENTYFQSRSIRYASDVSRRSSRSKLANILNRPGELSDNLVRPELDVLKRDIPSIEDLQKNALLNNAELLAIRQEVESAQQRVVSARARKKPTLDLELQAAEYSRKFFSRDRYRGGVVFEMPLSSSGALDAAIAQQRSQLIETRARLRKAEMDIQQQVLESWQLLTVIKAQRDEAAVFSDYRDAVLDKDRGLYELDVATDLGDSLALYSASLYQSAKADFDYALAWARLDALIGKRLTTDEINNGVVKK